MGELGGDVTPADEHNPLGQGLELEELRAGGEKLFAGNPQRLRPGPRGDHDVPPSECLAIRLDTATLDLDRASVQIDGRQAIRVDPSFRTSQPHIYAVGDVTNLPRRLETTAGREGTLAAENALSGAQHSIDYHTVPYTVFTHLVRPSRRSGCG